MVGTGILLVLLLGLGLTQGQSATRVSSKAINKLVKELRATASETAADPRVLLALRLYSQEPDPDTETILCHIQQQAVQDRETFSSGRLGLYVLALRASCVDPANIADASNTAPINLLRLLDEKLDAEMKSIANSPQPLTTYYQVALALLGLCELHSDIRKTDVESFSSAVTNGAPTTVDTQAVSALALRCLHQGSYEPSDAVWNALRNLTSDLLSAQTHQHTIGNLYSTGLAAQALIANEDLVPPALWDASEVLRKLRAQVEQGAFSLPVSAAQVLPALLRTSLLGAGQIHCSASAPGIWVTYTVTRAVDCVGTCSHSILVNVPRDWTILHMMEKAESLNPKFFEFTMEPSAWGPYVVSIGGTAADTQKRTYWQFLVGTQPIPVGVAAYKLSDGDHVVAEFTTY